MQSLGPVARLFPLAMSVCFASVLGQNFTTFVVGGAPRVELRASRRERRPCRKRGPRQQRTEIRQQGLHFRRI